MAYILWLDDIKSIKCEETTLYGYRNIINNNLIPKLGKYKLQELNPTILNKYFKEKLAGMLGLRREEIAGLKWDNIDLENKIITIAEARTQAGKRTVAKGTKNSSSHRTLYAPNEIINLLTTIKNKQEEQKTY